MRHRLTFSFTVLCVLIFPPAHAQLEQVPNTKLSVSVGPSRLETLLSQLAAQIHVKLKTSDSVRDEVLVLAAKGVSARDVLRRIASTTNTTWRATNDGLILELTPKNLRLEEEKRRARYLKSASAFRQKLEDELIPAFDPEAAAKWTATVRRLQKEIFALPAADEGDRKERLSKLSREITQAGGRNPALRLLQRILLTLDLSKLFEIPMGQKFEYSPTPTRMQFTLPASVGKMTEEFRRETSLVRESLESTPAQSGPSQLEWVANLPGRSVGPVDPNAIFLVMAERSERGVDVGLLILGPNGKETGFARVNLDLIREERPPVPLSREVLSRDIEIPHSLAVALAVKAGRRPGQREVDSRILPYLTSPLDHEWLELSGASLLPEAAAKANLNMIALLPDSVMSTNWQMPGPGGTVPKVRDAFQLLDDVGQTTQVDDGWIVARSDDLGSERAARANRRTLGRILSAVAARRTLSANEWLAEAAEPLSENLERFSWSGLQAFIDPVLMDWQFISEMKWIALLSPSQRRLAMSAEGCPVSALDKTQRAELERCVFFDKRTRERYPGERPLSWEESYLERDPTFALPDGLSDGRLFVSFESDREMLLLPAEGGVQYVDPEEFGGRIYWAEKDGAVSPVPPAAVEGLMERVESRVVTPAGKRGLAYFVDQKRDLRQAVAYSHAPAWFLDLVRKGYDAAKKGGS